MKTIYVENRNGRIYWGTDSQLLMEMETDPDRTPTPMLWSSEGDIEVQLARTGTGEVFMSTDRSSARSLAEPVTLRVGRNKTLVWLAPRSEGTWHGGYVSTTGGQEAVGPSREDVTE